MKIKGVKITWRDEELTRIIEKSLANVIVEVGLRAETKSKEKLQPSVQIDDRFVKGGGRGMRTATLRRSIHIAAPGYAWAGDDIPPKSGAPERGGKKIEPKKTARKLIIEIGSGMNYSVYVHEMHYNPTVKHFILESVKETKDDLPEIIARHKI